MSLVRKWMESEIIILSEISQTQKDKYTCFLLFVYYRTDKKVDELYKWDTSEGWEVDGRTEKVRWGEYD
jgi:hypothetical protein